MGEQKPEKTKKHICAGLLAHVHAGRTIASAPIRAMIVGTLSDKMPRLTALHRSASTCG